METSKFDFGLNNYILFVKGWYKDIKNRTYLEQVINVLNMDGYSYIKDIKDIRGLILSRFDNYNKWLANNKGYSISLYRILYNIPENDVTEYILKSIADLLRYSEDIKIDKPMFSKKLRKQGFVYSMYPNAPYKWINKHIDKMKIDWDDSK